MADDGIDIGDVDWGGGSVATPPPPTDKPTSLWDSFKTNILQPAVHGLAVAGEGAVHAVPDTIGFLGDLGYDALQNPLSPGPTTKLAIPGLGPVSQKVNQSFSKAEQDYTQGHVPAPRNTAEKYLNVASRGAADALVGGPTAPDRAMLSGASAGVSGQGAYDLTGNEDLSAVAALAGGFAPEAVHVINHVQTGRAIVRGASDPEFPDLVKTILGNEGGGTVDSPKVSSKGATGPMQVMMATAKDPGYHIRPWDGKTQADLVRVGTQYAAVLNDKYGGDKAKVLAAYNAGPGRVDHAVAKYGEEWAEHMPLETRKYISHGFQKLGKTPDYLGDEFEPASTYVDKGEGNDNHAFVEGLPDSEGMRHEDFFNKPIDEQEDIINNPVDPIFQQVPFDPNHWGNEDASAEKPIVDNTGYEAHTPYVETPNAPANDSHTFQTLDEFLDQSGNIKPEWRFEAQKYADLVRSKGDEHLANWLENRMPEPDLSIVKEPDYEEGPTFSKPEETSGGRSIVDVLKDLGNDESGSLNLGEIFGRGDKTGEGLNGEDIGRGYEGLSPEDKLLKAVKEARPLSSAQKRAYSAERGERFGNVEKIQQEGGSLENYHKQLGALKGAMSKVDFQSFARHFTEEDVNHLLNKIVTNKGLMPGEKVTAQTGLMKLLGAEGAKTPAPHELRALSNVLHPDVIQALMDNRPFAQKLGQHVIGLVNLPRTLMASYDLSAPLRQGVFLIGSKPFWSSFASMFKYFGSERAYQGLMDDIKSRPTYNLMRQAGLSITKHGAFINEREEAFMSGIAEKIPVIGKGVEMSERAYEGFLNKLRADTFDNIAKQYENIGVNLKQNPKQLRDIARFINAATGRGELKAFGRDFSEAAPALSAVFFSPRLIASRMNLLNPRFYLTLDPIVRQQAVKSLLSFGAIGMTVLGLAKAGGLNVGVNPTSSDFGKIKVNNTRFDIWGGFQQYVRLGAQLATGKTTNPSGQTKSLTSGKFGQPTRRDEVVQFTENKLSPVASFVDDWLRGKDGSGQPFKLKNELTSRFIPLFVQDVQSAYKDMGAKGLVTAGPASLFGVGVQTYSPRPSKSKANQPDAAGLQEPTLSSGQVGTNLGDVKW